MSRYLPRMARQERQIAFADALVANQYRLIDTVVKMGITSNLNSAHVIANRLLHSVPCQLRLKAHRKRTKMTADDVLKKLSHVASLDADFKGSDVVKCNELLAKHHGLIKERVETTDTTERDSTVDALTQHISQLCAREHCTEEVAIIESFSRMSDHPTLSKPENWGKFEPIIREHLANQANPVTEIGDQ